MLSDQEQFGKQLRTAQQALRAAQDRSTKDLKFEMALNRATRCLARATLAYGGNTQPQHKRVVRLAKEALLQTTAAIKSLEVHSKAEDASKDVRRAVQAIDRFLECRPAIH